MNAKADSRFVWLVMVVALLIGSHAVRSADPPLQDPGSGLVAWFEFEEGSGTALTDSSGSGNTGRILGSPSWTTGAIGGGLSFSGADFVRIAPSASFGLGVKTIAAWVNASDFTKLNSSFFGWGRRAADGSGECQDNYRGFVNRDGSLQASYQNSPGEVVVRPAPMTGAGVAKLGQWAHYAFVYNVSGTTITITAYKNGSAQGTYTGSDGLSNCGGLTAIGSQEDLPNPAYIRTMAGIVDDFRVYNRALSAFEVLALYNLRTPPTDTTAPSVPTGLTATAVSATQVNLAWNPSSDNLAVAGYVIYRGGSALAAVRSGTTYSDVSHTPATTYYFTLAPSTTYTYTVAAFDAAGNYSPASSSASATTPAASGTTYTLSVTMTGTGLSTLTSVPSGINCTSGTCSASFGAGTNVHLAPYPFIMGMWLSTPPFTGWLGGGCSGIGECVVRMNADTVIIAAYTVPLNGVPAPPTNVRIIR